MKRVVLVLLVIACLGWGVHWLNARNAPGGEAPRVRMAYADAQWGNPGAHFDVRYQVPEVFGEESGAGEGRQRLLFAPAQDGFRPQWQSYRTQRKGATLEQWTNRWVNKAVPQFGDEVIEAGVPDSVAGSPARKIVMRRVARKKGQPDVPLMMVKWCWVRGPHAYWVSGLCAEASYLSGHGVLYEAIKSTVRHVNEN